MTYDYRRTKPEHISDAVLAFAKGNKLAHVYMRGWLIHICREFTTREGFVCTYNSEASGERIIRDLAAEVGEKIRH